MAQYSGIFTTTQQMQAQAAGNWPSPPPPPDPYYEYVTMLLTGNGTNGAQNNTFVDSSSNNFTITRNGNTTQGSFSPYGSLWSNYFNNGTDDKLNVASNSSIPGTGDFTYECWIFPTATDGYRGALTSRHSSYPSYGFVIGLHDGNGYFYVNTTLVADASGIVANQWNHLALVRSGSGSNNCSAYINGTRVGQATETGSTNQNTVAVGRFYENNTTSDGLKFIGNISNVRMVNGSALYSGSTLTVPTTPLTAVSGTVLLTCQSNRFIDNSSNALSLTPGGITSVQRFSPFNPTASYDTATIGGSGYFDGSGDYLVVAGGSSNAYNFGTGNATVEAWVKTTSTGFQVIASNYSSGVPGVTDQWRLLIGQNTAGRVEWTQGSTIVAYNSKLVNDGAWHHVAAVINSGSVIIYVDGVGGSSASLSGYNYTATTDMYVGIYYYGSGVYGPFNGYITNLRINKGTAVYTSNFTPPTSPLTAISGTTALLNFINAGIPDSAMMNDLETVGNAQINTTTKKYGTGSIYLDGTGDALRGVPNNVNLRFGTGDFTVEGWFYQTADKTYPSALEIGDHITNGILFITKTSGNACVYAGGFYGGAATTLNQWNHIAWVRQSGSLKIFVNGVLGSTTAFTNDLSDVSVTTVGAEQTINANYAFPGYIDDLRVTKGYARYTANFTPPTAALPTY